MHLIKTDGWSRPTLGMLSPTAPGRPDPDQANRAAMAGESHFVVISPSPGFRRVLTVTGLSELFGLPDEGRPGELAVSIDQAARPDLAI